MSNFEIRKNGKAINPKNYLLGKNKIENNLKKDTIYHIVIGPIPFSSNGNTVNAPFSNKEITSRTT